MLLVALEDQRDVDDVQKVLVAGIQVGLAIDLMVD